MFEISAQNAADYLQSAGYEAKGEPIQVRELAGGVSNVVLLVTLPNRLERFVLKQARERLRVKDEWLCPVERIWREADVLRACEWLFEARSAEVPAVTRVGGVQHGEPMEVEVPSILWEDRENYLYAMTAAPGDHRTWKEMLLTGEIESSGELAAACGRMLGRLHALSWRNPGIAAAFEDRTWFDRLRLDPYYRQIARVHADLAPAIGRLIDSVLQNRCSLVHGDFSPKNLLVWPGHIMLIDFEVGHFGDPAFDLGFFLTHLLLKSVWAGERHAEYLQIADAFWHSYELTVIPSIEPGEWTALEQRTLLNLAGCMLARIDGKSRVEYLSAEQQQRVRETARRWIASPPQSWPEALLVPTLRAQTPAPHAPRAFRNGPD